MNIFIKFLVPASDQALRFRSLTPFAERKNFNEDISYGIPHGGAARRLPPAN